MKLRAGEDVLLGILPIFHIYGLVLVQFGAITQGAKLVMLPRFEPKSFLESIQKHKVLTSQPAKSVGGHHRPAIRMVFCWQTDVGPLFDIYWDTLCGPLAIIA